MQYRKRPVVIEARQWDGSTHGANVIVDWIHEGTDPRETRIAWQGDYGTIAIKTLEGTMAAVPQDWIIKGVKGEFYPCKPDIFAATYELVA